MPARTTADEILGQCSTPTWRPAAAMTTTVPPPPTRARRMPTSDGIGERLRCVVRRGMLRPRHDRGLVDDPFASCWDLLHGNCPATAEHAVLRRRGLPGLRDAAKAFRRLRSPDLERRDERRRLRRSRAVAPTTAPAAANPGAGRRRLATASGDALRRRARTIRTNDADSRRRLRRRRQLPRDVSNAEPVQDADSRRAWATPVMPARTIADNDVDSDGVCGGVGQLPGPRSNPGQSRTRTRDSHGRRVRPLPERFATNDADSDGVCGGVRQLSGHRESRVRPNADSRRASAMPATSCPNDASNDVDSRRGSAVNVGQLPGHRLQRRARRTPTPTRTGRRVRPLSRNDVRTTTRTRTASAVTSTTVPATFQPGRRSDFGW